MKANYVIALTEKYGINLDEKRLRAYTETFYEFPETFEDYLYCLVNGLPMHGELINIAFQIDSVR